MNALFPTILKILAILSSLIVIAEDALGSGTGEQKKAKVIADVQAQLSALACRLGVPDWAVAVFKNGSALELLVNSLMAISRESGHLTTPGSSASSPGAVMPRQV